MDQFPYIMLFISFYLSEGLKKVISIPEDIFKKCSLSY